MLSSTIVKNYSNNRSKVIFALVYNRFIKYQIKRKYTKQLKNNLIFNLFKMYVYIYFHVIKYNKNYKFNKKINKFVYRPNFNIIKHKYTVAKFPSIKKNKITIVRKKKIASSGLKLLLFFLFNYACIFNNFKIITKTKLNKVGVFSNILYAMLKLAKELIV